MNKMKMSKNKITNKTAKIKFNKINNKNLQIRNQ